MASKGKRTGSPRKPPRPVRQVDPWIPRTERDEAPKRAQDLLEKLEDTATNLGLDLEKSRVTSHEFGKADRATYHTFDLKFAGVALEKDSFAIIREVVAGLKGQGYDGPAVINLLVDEGKNSSRAKIGEQEHWIHFGSRETLTPVVSSENFSDTGKAMADKHNYQSIKGVSVLLRVGRKRKRKGKKRKGKKRKGKKRRR